MTERDEALAPERVAELAEALGGHWPSGDPRTHEATCGYRWRSGEHFLGDAEGAHEAWVAHVAEAVGPLVAGWLAEARARALGWCGPWPPSHAAIAEPGDQSGEAE